MHRNKIQKSPFTIFFVDLNGMHQNIIVYDRKSNTVERFEPQGVMDNHLEKNDDINNVFKSTLVSLGLNNFNFNQSFCPFKKPY